MTDDTPTVPTRLGREGDSQAMPVPNGHTDIQTLVIRELEQRRQLGIERYGTALQPFNGRDGLQDLYEELMDGMVYVRQEIEERKLRSDALAELLDAAEVLRATWRSGGELGAGVECFFAIIDELDELLGK